MANLGGLRMKQIPEIWTLCRNKNTYNLADASLDRPVVFLGFQKTVRIANDVIPLEVTTCVSMSSSLRF